MCVIAIVFCEACLPVRQAIFWKDRFVVEKKTPPREDTRGFAKPGKILEIGLSVDALRLLC